MKLTLTLSLLSFSLALTAQSAVGEAVNSVQSGPWNSAETWDCECIPSDGHDVTILNGHQVETDAGDTLRAESLVVEFGAQLALPQTTRLELAVALSAFGILDGQGTVAFVGEGEHQCGPARLHNLDFGQGTTLVVNPVWVTGVADLGSAEVETQGMLTLEGVSGLRSDGGTLIGDIVRDFSWTKTTEYTYHIGAGVAGATASALLDQPGAEYVKSWVEAATGYQTLLAEDTLVVGDGFNCDLPQGTYVYSLTGEAVTEATWTFTANSSSAFWKGWHLKSNPLTGFTDITAGTTTGPGSLGATYQWVDSLQTYAVQVGGLGQFGQAGIFAPGEAFWTIADSAFDMTFTEAALVDRVDWENQQWTGSGTPLTLNISDGTLDEQCTVALSAGQADYDRTEDALFHNAFRGRNNLDLYSKTADDVSVMVNATTAEAGTVIPIYTKGLNGMEVTLTAPSVPDDLCLVLEDIIDGWSAAIEPGMAYTYSVTTAVDEHRFNLIVGGTIHAESTDAACASAQDGTIAVMGPDSSSTFTLEDASGQPAGTFTAEGEGGTFSGLTAGTYTVTAMTSGCSNLVRTVDVGAGGNGDAPFDIQSIPDHIGCYDEHGGVDLTVDGGFEPYTVDWGHGASGLSIDVMSAGLYSAVITDAAGCQDSTTVEVLAAPQVSAAASVSNPVIAWMDGVAEVTFTNESTGATGYQWNFGDGGSSTDEEPLHGYTEAGSYTVGLNAWNDYCSDTYQMVVTVEVVSSVGESVSWGEPALGRVAAGWEIHHPAESFTVEVYDLTGRMVQRQWGGSGLPLLLPSTDLPAVSLIRWEGQQSGRQKTWRVAR